MAYFEQVTVADTNGNPVNAATEPTLQALQALTTTIAQLTARLDEQNDSQVAILSSMLAKTALTTKYGELKVTVESNGNSLNSPYYGLTLNTIGDGGTGANRPLMVPSIFSATMAGTGHIYNNITVS